MGAVKSESRLRQNLAEVEQGIPSHVATMPGHPQFLDGHCTG